MDMIGQLASSPAMGQIMSQMGGGAGGGAAGGGGRGSGQQQGAPPDFNQLLASVMPMVGQVLGGGGAPGGAGSARNRSRSPQRGDLSELDAELPAADAARWRARIAADKAAIDAAAGQGQPRKMSAAFVAAGGLGGGGGGGGSN